MTHVYAHNQFRSGDQVKHFGEDAEVVQWPVPYELRTWAVPIVYKYVGDGLVTLVHADHLTIVTQGANPKAAVIGDLDFSGIWQPTGTHFEVMFIGTDPVGHFYLRERQ